MELNTLILEAHPLLQLGLVHLLETHAEFQVWGVADSTNTALTLLQKGLCEDKVPDLMLLSPARPDISRSLSLVKQLQQSNTRVRILALLDMGEAARSHAAALVNNGVQGCCLKSKPASHILQAMTAIASNSCWMDSELNTATQQWRSPYSTTAPSNPSPTTQLSNRERQVLKEIATGKSNREIAGSLQVAESTVKSHIVRILRKMGVRDRTQAAVLAMRSGLV